jgi:hypothetical protein
MFHSVHTCCAPGRPTRLNASVPGQRAGKLRWGTRDRDIRPGDDIAMCSKDAMWIMFPLCNLGTDRGSTRIAFTGKERIKGKNSIRLHTGIPLCTAIRASNGTWGAMSCVSFLGVHREGGLVLIRLLGAPDSVSALRRSEIPLIPARHS